MSKHTPGPWHYGELGEKIRAQQGRERPTFIAQMLDLPRGEEEKLANAALIAAAPEMFEALKKIAQGEGIYGAQAREYKEIARAAIAKLEAH